VYCTAPTLQLNMVMEHRDLTPEKGDTDAMADKVENVEGVDVVHLTRRILWKMDTRLVLLFVPTYGIHLALSTYPSMDLYTSF